MGQEQVASIARKGELYLVAANLHAPLKGDKGCGHEDATNTHSEMFFVHESDPSIIKELFWTYSNIKQDNWTHEWSYTPNKRSVRRSDIQEYGDDLRINIDLPTLRKYPRVSGRSKRLHKVWATIEVTVKGLDQAVTFILEPPGIDLGR